MSYLMMCANSKEYQEYLKQKKIEEEKKIMSEKEAEQYLEGIDESVNKEKKIEDKKEEDNEMVKLIGEE